jgi:hypothetical protein
MPPIGGIRVNAPRNDVAPLKTITYRATKTKGTLIVITNCVVFTYLASILSRRAGADHVIGELKQMIMITILFLKFDQVFESQCILFCDR